MELISLAESWNDWNFSTNGKFTGWDDKRGLYCVRYPWEESTNGEMAEISRTVAVPKNWQGPVILSFFAADNHHGEDYNPDDWPHYVGADIFWEHRFSQVLVDEDIVWERDVAKSDSPSWKYQSLDDAYADFFFTVDISDRVRPGQTFNLTLRIFDKVGSGTELPKDVHVGHYWESEDVDRNQTNKYFDFMAFWGDVFLTSDPSQDRLRPGFEDHISLVPPATDQAKWPDVVQVELPIARAELLPDMPYPIWGGTPFPQGLVTAEKNIRLIDSSGIEVPAQVSIRSRWQDGSAQWVWITLVVQPGQTRFIMECGAGVNAADIRAHVHVEESDSSVTISNDLTTVRMSTESQSFIESLSGGGTEYGPIAGIVNQQMLGYLYRHKAVPQKIQIEEQGPVRVSVVIDGELWDEDGHNFGRFRARVWMWAGCPLIALSYRIFQELDCPVAMIDDMLLEVNTPPSDEVAASFSKTMRRWQIPANRKVSEVELRQMSAEEYAVTGVKKNVVLESGKEAPGWVESYGSTGGIALGVKWFRQQGPKSLTVTPDKTIVGLFARRALDDWKLDSPIYFMTRGEAKRHHLWMLPHDGTASAELLDDIQKAWDARPHLMNEKWFRDSGVMGNAADYTEGSLAELDRKLQEKDAQELEVIGWGVRDFRETEWCQNYRGRAANAIQRYISTGRTEWQSYFEQIMAHNLDVDTIHFEPNRPDWVGAIRSYSPYHTTGDASHAINSNCQDQFLHYFFTGEPDTWDEAISAADYIVRSFQPGRSARQEGWPLAQMSIAYLWTGNVKYLEAANRIFQAALAYTHPRRGVFDSMHSSFSHRGAVPFMTGYLGFGLIRYHQVTGDDQAAKLLVALSEGTTSEAGDGKGGFWYSPCPTQRNWGSSAWSILMGAMMAYSYRLTGDDWFLKQARLCRDKVIAGVNIGLDMTPTLGEMVSVLKDG